MSIKSFIQIIILIIILVILGSVYFQYFSKEKILVEETTNLKLQNEKLFNDLENKILELEKKNNKLRDEIEIKIDQLNKKKELEENLEAQKKLDEIEKKLKEEKKLLDEEKKLLDNVKEIETSKREKLAEVENKLKEEKKLLDEEKKLLDEEKKLLDNAKKFENEKKESNTKEKKIINTVKDVEYITTDKKGNKFRLLATSAKSNKKNNNILDLQEVRGVITSDIRDPIYIVSDFAQYNSSNSNSKFYQNVIINHIDKEIICENFDIDMETNEAIAYNNVTVTDPKSTMKAGIITFDLETKNININPESDETKIKVISD